MPNTVQPGSNFAEIEILREDQVDRSGAQGVSFQADETTHFIARMLSQVVSVGCNAKHTRDCKEEKVVSTSTFVQQSFLEAVKVGEGILRLEPCWVPRSFMIPGGAFGLLSPVSHG